MTLEGASIGGNLIFNDQFHALGFVTLRGAHIAGQLVGSCATFENRPPPGAPVSMPALDGSLTNIALGVFLGPQFRAEGEVRMQAARIGTVFNCENATFNNPVLVATRASGFALTADGIHVGGRFALTSGFRAEGEVFLIGAQIGGDLDCGGGQFHNPPLTNTTTVGRALSAQRISVKGNVFVRSGFSSRGDVSFAGSSIEGNLEGTCARFGGELNLESVIVKGALMLSDVTDPGDLRLTLTNASVGALADEARSWPPVGNILLDGFVYERFSGPAPKDHKSRLRWLALQEPFLPRPYRQVAKILKEEGENAGSVEILYELERRVHARERRLWRLYFADPIQKWAVGYGYYPTRAFWWLAGFFLLGFALYGIGYAVGSVTPSDKDAYATFELTRQVPAHYQSFHASIFSAENTFPFLKLGQSDRWQPDPHPQKFAWGVTVFATTIWVSFAGLLRWYQWLQILSGWILGTLFIAGVTGIIRKD